MATDDGGVAGDDAVDSAVRRVFRAELDVAICAAHMHEYGTTREQIAQISLNARRNAALNPKAVLTKPLTLDEYLSSPMISDPLCLYDCDIAIDGATAVVISDAAYAPDTPNQASTSRPSGARSTAARRGTSGRT